MDVVPCFLEYWGEICILEWRALGHKTIACQALLISLLSGKFLSITTLNMVDLGFVVLPENYL